MRNFVLLAACLIFSSSSFAATGKTVQCYLSTNTDEVHAAFVAHSITNGTLTQYGFSVLLTIHYHEHLTPGEYEGACWPINTGATIAGHFPDLTCHVQTGAHSGFVINLSSESGYTHAHAETWAQPRSTFVMPRCVTR